MIDRIWPVVDGHIPVGVRAWIRVMLVGRGEGLHRHIPTVDTAAAATLYWPSLPCHQNSRPSVLSTNMCHDGLLALTPRPSHADASRSSSGAGPSRVATISRLFGEGGGAGCSFAGDSKIVEFDKCKGPHGCPSIGSFHLVQELWEQIQESVGEGSVDSGTARSGGCRGSNGIFGSRGLQY